MNQQEAETLIERYLQGTATVVERQLVENWYSTFAKDKMLLEDDSFEHIAAELWVNTRIRANLPSRRRTVRFWPPLAIAASVILALVTGGYLYLNKQDSRKQIIKGVATLQDILPGSNKAVLILANGKQIILNNVKKGRIARENNALIDKTVDGQVAYHSSTDNGETIYNTMATPRGGQYSLILADGTKVILNAASSLKFPAAFNGASRTVELSGEAYFEVAHDSSKPFRVINRGQTIEVVGTHFNIKDYDDEETATTTLLEGSVKVFSGNEKAWLKPGQQSLVDRDNGHGHITVTDADTDEAVAWENGLFEFKNATIKEVMQSAARWYNVEVTYAGKAPDIRITGRISRNVNFSGLKSLLEFEGVKFRIEGKSVKITN